MNDDAVQRDIARQIHHEEFVRRKPEHWAFRARVGKKGLFPTSSDAVQYERGFAEYPNQPPGLVDSPRMAGYLDAAEADAHETNLRDSTWREERRTSAFAVLA